MFYAVLKEFYGSFGLPCVALERFWAVIRQHTDIFLCDFVELFMFHVKQFLHFVVMYIFLVSMSLLLFLAHLLLKFRRTYEFKIFNVSRET